MYPTLVLVPAWGLAVSTFSLMMALGFVVAFVLARRDFETRHLDRDTAGLVLAACVVGGLLGARLYFAVDMSIRTGAPMSVFLLQSGGLTWFGGLGGALICSFLTCRALDMSFQGTLEACAVAIPTGQAIGRLGCWLVGDDYGVPSSLPWAQSFPLGSPPTLLPVHPTQLYEAAWLFGVAAILNTRRAVSPSPFAEYLIAAGLGRVAVEGLRLGDVFILGLTEAQIIGVALVGIGIVMRRSAAADSEHPEHASLQTR